MARCGTEDADDTAISFELGSLFEPNNVVFDEIEEQDIPDELLVGLLDEVKENEAIIHQNQHSIHCLLLAMPRRRKDL